MKNRKKIIVFFIIFFIIGIFILEGVSSSSKNGKGIFFFSGVLYKDNKVELSEFKIKSDMYPGDFIETKKGLTHPDAYEIRLVTKYGKVVFSGVQIISFLVYLDPPLDGSERNNSDIIQEKKRNLFLKIPYSKSADFLQIFRKGVMIYSLDISKFICIDDGSCPDYCNTSERTDLDCGSDLTTTIYSTTTSTTTTTTVITQKGGNDLLNYIPWILIAFFIILVIFLFYFANSKKKREDNYEEIKDYIKVKLKDGEDPKVLKESLEEEGLDSSLVDEIERKLW